MAMTKLRKKEVSRIKSYYTRRMKTIQTEAMAATQRDARKNVGGQIRHLKGKLVEELAGEILISACKELDIDMSRVKIERKFKVGTGITDPNYIGALPPEVAEYVAANIADMVVDLEVDMVLLIDGKLVLGVECKSFTEKTMFGRAVKDAAILYKYHPNRRYIILQLENALGGDYAHNKEVYLGSAPAHVAMSDHPELEIEICTLLDGRRTSTRPIHEERYYKEISTYKLNRTLDKFEEAITTNLKALPQRRIYQYNYSYIT